MSKNVINAYKYCINSENMFLQIFYVRKRSISYNKHLFYLFCSIDMNHHKNSGE